MGRLLEAEFVGRTYDDFLFRPQGGRAASRREIRLTGRLSRGLSVELPVCSANMDSVTEAGMAKTMALEGGLGFIHRAMPVEAQAQSVARVKRSYGYVVERPVCLPRDATIREAREFTQKHNITGILMEETRGSNVLAGLLSNRDMPWRPINEGRRVDEFMTPLAKLITGSPEIGVEDAERRMFERRIEKLPLVDDRGQIRGLITKRDIILARQRPDSTKYGKRPFPRGAAIGARGDFLERAAELVKAGADVLVIDIADAHSEAMRQAVERFRARFPDVELVCGNVGTAAGAEFLKDLGADGIKVGIGPGRVCRTRLETPAGVPQLQAIRQAWCARGAALPLIADGGIKEDKDIFLPLLSGPSPLIPGSL